MQYANPTQGGYVLSMIEASLLHVVLNSQYATTLTPSII